MGALAGLPSLNTLVVFLGLLLSASSANTGTTATATTGTGATAKSVVELTDENFDELTKTGVWMVKIYAPWCTHCRQLEPLWNVFGEEGKADGISVAKVDGTKEKTLMTRFKVTAFPTIYLLREGRTYEYAGARNVQSFRNFATTGYKSQTAWPIYKAPNSVFGRAVGQVLSVPLLVKRVYRVLHHDKGLSDVAIVLGFLSVPVLCGAVLICLVDAVYVRRARDDVHEHEE